MKNYRTAFIVAVGWLLFITILLCIPGSRLPKFNWQDKVWLDKWVHIVLFLLLTFLWCLAYSIKKESSTKLFITVTISFIIYGILMEIVQHFFIPFRSFDMGDIIADAFGAMAGYFIATKRLVRTKKIKDQSIE